MDDLLRSKSQKQHSDQRLFRRAAAAGGAIVAVTLAVVAWWPAWPISVPPYGAVDGVVMIGLGVCLVGVPALPAVAAAAAARRHRAWLLAAVPLMVLAIYVGFFWTAVMLYFRDPEVAFIW